MRQQEKEKAIKLRLEGCSMNEIARILNTAKSNISSWVHDVQLNSKQIKNLSERAFRKEIIEKRKATRLKNESAKRQVIIDTAQKQIEKLSRKELWLIGIMLYWAEGGKTQRGLVRFSNGDPEMIKIMMVFFRKVCQVPEEKFRGYIHIHPHLDHKKAEKYWSLVTGIPLKKFFKTYRKTNISSKNKRDTLPFGTLDIYICDTKLFLKISGWAKGVFNSY